ncbi:MAG: metal ABC transporter ATP-binding protein [Spirochaetia bacterium]
MEDKIVFDNVTFRYEAEPVLQDVSFRVEKGEIITVIGPNGGGKTTLLKLILGTLKPEKGRVLIDGNKPSLLQKQVGYVPQYMDTDRKFPVTLFDVVLTGRIRPFGFYSRKDREKSEKALEEVGLVDKRDELFSSLSGGQVQRALIARALVTNMEILLLDEPTANVDPSAGMHIHEILKSLSDRLTIVLVTHDTSFVSDITDRVLCINRTVAEHPIDENFSEIVASAYGSGAKIVRHDTSITDQHEGDHR